METENNYGRKLTGDQAGEIKWLLKNTNYTSLKEIADRYSITAVMVGKIRDDKLWKRVIPVRPSWHEKESHDKNNS